MTAYFRCPACDGRHPTRVRASHGQTPAVMMREVGSVLEPCPASGDWVRIGVADLIAIQDPPPPRPRFALPFR